MRKSELIQRVALLNPDLPDPLCRMLVEKLFNAVIDHLRNGGAVELRGFGRFFLASMPSEPFETLGQGKPS